MHSTLIDLRDKGVPKYVKVGAYWRLQTEVKNEAGAEEGGQDVKEHGSTGKGTGSSPASNAGMALAVEPPSPFSHRTPTCGGATSDGGDEPCMGKSGSSRWKIQDPIPRQYASTVEGLPPQYLAYILSLVEKISLSMGNLNLLKAASKCRFIPKQLLVQLYEKTTGGSKDDPITAAMRSLDFFVECVRTKNVERGRPMAERILPVVDWTDPAYATYVLCDRTEKSCSVQNTILKQTCTLPRAFLAAVKDTGRLYVDTPWSDRRATCVDAGGFGRFPLFELFKWHANDSEDDDVQADGKTSKGSGSAASVTPAGAHVGSATASLVKQNDEGAIAADPTTKTEPEEESSKGGQKGRGKRAAKAKAAQSTLNFAPPPAPGPPAKVRKTKAKAE